MNISIRNIILAVILLANICSSDYINASQVKSSDIAPYVFPANIIKSPKAFSYMPDGLSYLSLSDNHKMIVRYDTEKGVALDTIINVSKTRETTIDEITGFIISPDGSKLLVYKDVEPIYRRSFEAGYYVFEIKRNILRPLSKQFKKQRAPLFSPDSRMVAFVAENNIYIKKIDYDSEVAVTVDGKRNSVINGVPDWTYEEEFMVKSSMAWAPDNLTLCFIKYNEKDVNTYSFPLYGGACDPTEDYALYPGEYTYKYPKPGTKNSSVSVHSYDVDNRKIKDIQLNSDNIEYIPKIAYANNAESLVIITLNRAQNRMEFLLANPKTTITKSLYADESKSWINEVCYNDVRFYKDCFVVSSARSGYNHLYKYSYNGVELSQITNGEYDVLKYYGNDAKGNHYYQSTKTGAINRIITRKDTKGKEVDITPLQGCASAVFSPAMNYYMVNYSDVNTPPSYTLFDIQSKKLRILEDNASIGKKYGSLPKREFFEMISDGNILNGYMIKPTAFDASKKYPVIMTHYNGPGSQVVLNKWSVDWENYFATHGYIVVCVDGRGTGGRGQAFQSVVYKRLGYYETIDQLAAANHVSSLPYVDSERIGIYGWSYGGYETLMAISHDKSPYSAAVAIAPVTDWRFYDTAYTERFMMTPQENEEGYRESSAMNKVNKVNCPLLIMSGTSDDNVHVSNTMEYVSQLISNGKYCDMLLFPNMNHSIYHCGSRAVVYAKMLDYFNRNLNVK